VLSDRDLFVVDRDHPSADLAARVRVLRGERPPAGVRVRRGAVGRARKDAARYRRQLGDAPAGSDVRSEARGADDPDGAGRLVAAAWPERIAGIRDGQRGRFLLAGGRGATLADGDVLAGEAYLAVAQVDRGQREARIHLAAALDLRGLRDAVGDLVDVEELVVWRDGDVVAERRERLGALVLATASIEGDTPAARYDALLDGLRAEGLQLLGWDDDARELRDRVRFLRRHQGASWPAWDDASLLESLEDVVGPFLLQARRRADLADVRMVQVLRSRLSRERLRDLDRLAPTHLTVPSGSRVRLDYAADGAPVLAVRVQEVFGSRSTPVVLDGQVPVLLHLLSPARRPVQVTDDLEGFWERSYPQVRAELRGRYPKHAWPEDLAAAAPLRGTRRRR
jgi:ATP-dependent helicase HrpB